MPQVMDHVRELAETIGPRPACTDAEASAANYIEDAFQARGLETERQEFDCPRTYSWAHVIYHVLTIGAAALSLWFGWPAFVIAVAAAVMLWLDLDTRFTIARFLGKGPSQNVIARHVPRQRRGERLRRVVIVAHYDTAKTSLAFSPGMVRNLPLLQNIAKAVTALVPLLILIGAMPFAVEWRQWTSYIALGASAYLLFPLLVMVHRELFSQSPDGANDNASGLAAMLGVMVATVPEPDEAITRDRPLRRGMEPAFDLGEPEDELLAYRPVGSEERAPVAEAMPLEGFGDVDWDTGVMPPVRTPAAEPPAPTPAPTGDWDDSVASLWDEPAEEAPPTEDAWQPRTRAPKPTLSSVPANWAPQPRMEPFPDENVAEGQEELPLGVPKEQREPRQEPEDEHDRHGHGISAWLGIGKGFDVRKAGKKIGSWDNIESDEDEDDFGYKGGAAGELGEDSETADLASRIRRRVTENVDRSLAEKEIWFVATGADEAGGWGMKHLLETYADELGDALIINIEAVGAGTVAFVTEEGAARSYRGDRRLIAQSKRTVRENGLSVKGASYRGFTTSATPALARRFKAMSVMAFDINGRVPNWHWHTDVTDNVSEQTIDQATAFVTALLRDL